MNTNDFAISIPKYFIELLKKWRIFILSGLIFAVLLGGYKSVKKYQEINSADYKEKQQESYMDAMEEYNASQGVNELTKEQTSQKLETLNEYIKDSVLMKLDPYSVYVASTDISFQAEGAASIDNMTVVDSFLGDCAKLLQEDAMYAYINEKTGLSVEEKYMQELIKNVVDYSGNVITVSVYYTTGEDAEIILDAIISYLQENQKEIYNGVSVSSVVSEYGSTVTINKEFQDLQNKVYSQIDSLQTMNTKYDVEVSKPAEPDFSNSGVIKAGIKWSVFGFIGGVLLIMFISTLVYLLNGKLKNAKDINNTLGIPVIGVARGQKQHKCFKFVDRWIELLEQRIYGSEDLAMQVFQFNVLLREYASGVQKIMITSTLGNDIIREGQTGFLDHVEKGSIEWDQGGNLISDINTADHAINCDAIILVEKIGASQYMDLIKEKQMLEKMKVNILGCICVE
ncbi:MAG: hypothetical protein PHS82_03750 [Lachnospiraceae bacterium]|nr:hypothetical protein [Lachnospiraceae bacterium]